eukprot:160674-Amphidinium_carterae.1
MSVSPVRTVHYKGKEKGSKQVWSWDQSAQSYQTVKRIRIMDHDHGIHPGQSHRIRRTFWIKGESELDQSVQAIPPGVQTVRIRMVSAVNVTRTSLDHL